MSERMTTKPQHSTNKLIILGAAYLYQRIHQRLSISQSLVCADCMTIFHFVSYKWHEGDWSRVSHSATAGKVLDKLPFTSQLPQLLFFCPRKCFIQWQRVVADPFPRLYDALVFCSCN